MARILSIDYGRKRCGIAATDPLQIVVSAIDTVRTVDLMTWLKGYLKDEEVEKLVIGKPSHADGSDTYLVHDIKAFAGRFSKAYPDIDIDYQDESYSSVMAKEIILQSGVKKKKRRDKSLIDKMSAVLILQKYLNHI